jgi:hypothetical protein
MTLSNVASSLLVEILIVNLIGEVEKNQSFFNPFSPAFFPLKKIVFCEIPLSGTTSKQEKK